MVSLEKLLLFGIFLISAYLYFPLNKRRSRYYWKSPIDREVPLVPIFVIPYYFYLIYAPLALLAVWLFTGALFTRFLIAFIIANFTAAVFWYFFPNGVRRPKIKRKGFFFTKVKDLYSNDKHDTNAFPSNHVYGVIICSYYLSVGFPSVIWLFGLVGLSIVVSSILVKQHNVIDLFGGIFWAIVSIFLANFFI